MASDSAFAGLSKIGIAIAAGLGVGLALGWQEYARTTQGVTENFSVTQAVDAGLVAASVNTEKEPPSTFPILEVIGGEVYNFGVSEPGVDLTHTFRVKNRGTAPLELRLQDVTCKCLTMGLGKDEVTTVPPGGELISISSSEATSRPTRLYRKLGSRRMIHTRIGMFSNCRSRVGLFPASTFARSLLKLRK